MKHLKRTLALTLALGLGLSLTSQAEARPHRPPHAEGAPFGGPERGMMAPQHNRALQKSLRKHFVPPHFVVRHMEELKLTEAQREQLKGLLKGTQSQHVDHTFALEGASQAFVKSLDNGAPQEEVLQNAEALIAAEGKLKRARLNVALSLRALLTPEQLEQAKELLKERHKARRKGRKGKARKGDRRQHKGWRRKGERGHRAPQHERHEDDAQELAPPAPPAPPAPLTF